MSTMNLFREEGRCFKMKALWDDEEIAEITLNREYDDWHEKNKVEDVYMYIDPNNGFCGVTLTGRENLRKLANAILAEIKRDEQQT